MIWALVIVAGALLFYYFLFRPQQYWSDRNVKQGTPIPILGDNFWTITGQEAMMDTVKRLYNRNKDRR